MSDDHVCLLVQRAGITREFRLRGRTVHFGYAPGGENDLILYDSLLEDVQGVIERQDGPPEEGFTAYRLRARSAGIAVEGVPLPPRTGAEVRLRLNHRIKVGRHYQLTVAGYTPAGGGLAGLVGAGQQRSEPPAAAALRPELQEYMAVSRLFFQYLPEIYRSQETAGPDAPHFLARFLALFESVFLPVQWTVQNYSLCLQPESTPPELLASLADWYGVPARIDFLCESRQRLLLGQMHDLLQRKGTAAGLSDLLSTLLGAIPAIVDEQEADHFTVDLNARPEWWEAHREDIVALIEWYKPAHTTFQLK